MDSDKGLEQVVIDSGTPMSNYSSTGSNLRKRMSARLATDEPLGTPTPVEQHSGTTMVPDSEMQQLPPDSSTTKSTVMEEVVTDEPLRAPNPAVVELLELVTTCEDDQLDLARFKAELNKYPLDITAGPQIFDYTTPLHLAACHGKLEIAKLTMASPQISAQVVNAEDRSGNFIIAKLLLDCQEKRELLHATDWNGIAALDIAKGKGDESLVDLLECCDITWLEQERQNNANSVNTILVGAALVASMAFGSLLQPPLFVSNQYNALTNPGNPAPAASPDAPVASPQPHAPVSFNVILQGNAGGFIFFTVISFIFSVASLTTGTGGILPNSGGSLKQEVKHLRRSVRVAATYLHGAIYFLAIAYSLAAGVLFGVVFNNTLQLVISTVVLIGVVLVAIGIVVGPIKAANDAIESEKSQMMRRLWNTIWEKTEPYNGWLGYAMGWNCSHISTGIFYYSLQIP